MACTLLRYPRLAAKQSLLIRSQPKLYSRLTQCSYFHSSSVLNARPELTTQQLDAKWKQIWDKCPSRKQLPLKPDGSIVPSKGKYFALSMFPYPSGMLHIGHLRVYTIIDVLARYRRMNGYEVINPMGWDSFGLPAENAAIERGIDPEDWTLSNIEKMKEQMNLMFADFDWEREVVTCSPEYYKWTQKLFLMMYEAGLAYRKDSLVNWDPVDKTVLANEQVDANGRSWRSGAVVEHKMLEQWFLKITDYAQELHQDLQLLKQWPDNVKIMQRNWIGGSTGARIKFDLQGAGDSIKELEAFTTRPDTLFGVQYVAISLNHEIAKKAAESDPELAKFLETAKNLPEDTKAGYKLKDITVSNPLFPGEFSIPVFVAPYVIGDYGYGTVMGCPGHDTRDFDFWKENMPGEPIIETITPPPDYTYPNGVSIYFKKDGTLNENCGPYKGLDSRTGGEKIVKDLMTSGKAHFETQWKLRDWLISRQRFWGAPIPIIHCDSCGTVPVPDEQLPVLLPKHLNGPLSTSEEFVNTSCPSCGGHAKRDTDTMDTFMDSSWYIFRYTDPKNTELIFDPKKASELMPVDLYVGGVEHAILHLLYFRFISKFLHKNGNWNGGNMNGEPIKQLLTQGMVQGKTNIDPDSGKFLKKEEVDFTNPHDPKVKATGKPCIVKYEKMSKSKYNGASPEECIQKHGADATRAHILFQAPVSDVLNWDENQISGVKRWLNRVTKFTTTLSEMIEKNAESSSSKDEYLAKIIKDSQNLQFEKLNPAEQKVWAGIQSSIKQITDALHKDFTLNTLISDYMKLSNLILTPLDSKKSKISVPVSLYSITQFLKLISPVVPVHAEDNWEFIQKTLQPGKEWTSIFAESWPEPQFVPNLNNGRFVVLVNGKRKLMLPGPKSAQGDVNKILELVKADTEGKAFLETTRIKDTVLAKDFVINIITE